MRRINTTIRSTVVNALTNIPTTPVVCTHSASDAPLISSTLAGQLNSTDRISSIKTQLCSIVVEKFPTAMEVIHMDIVHALCLNMIEEDEISNYSFHTHIRYT